MQILKIAPCSAIARTLLPLFMSLLAGCVNAPEPASQPAAAASDAQPESQPWPEFESAAAQNFIRNCQNVFNNAVEQFSALESGRFTSDVTLLQELNNLEVIIDSLASPASLYRNVHPDEEVRNAADVCQQKTVSLITEISLSRPLYDQLASVPLDGLQPLAQRYLANTLEDFRRSGVDKDEQTRARVRELNDEILLIGQEFNRNIRDDVRSVEAKVEELAGLPEDFIASHPVNEKGTVTITTDYPDYLPVMQYAHDDDLRLRLYQAFRQRAYPDNRDVLKSLLEKRYELARLLGFKNYAEYITADKMIGSPENAQAFIEDVNLIALPRSNQDYQVLLERLQKIDPSATEVGDWQKTYLENLIKSDVYEVDAQKVRQYFSYPKVRDGIFDLVETMFEVEIRPWQTPVWHPSVESFEIWDKGMLVGQFYLDMHPREGKYKHAAAFGVREGVRGVQTPISALVCNFPGGDGSTALMEHDQVETFLHEFGHLLHGLFAGHQPWLGLSGISTEWDFVEAPSQMLEEWVWDPETLRSFATNNAGEVIPEVLVERMRKARDFGRGLWSRHQMYYAALSLNYYNNDPAQIDLDGMMKSLQVEYSPFDYVDDTYLYASFGHLDGYSAIYYTYMWSLVIAADMFSEFEQEGLRNPAVARRYRQTVLAPGGTKDAAELVQDFLGRPYSFDAFKKMLESK